MVVPLLVGHLVDCGFVQPDAVVDDQGIERTKAVNSRVHQRFGVGGAGEVSLHGVAAIDAAFLHQPQRFCLRMQVIEDYASPGADKQAHSRGANAARASGDEGNFSVKR